MRFLITLTCGLGLSGCADGSSRFPVSSENQAALNESVSLIRLDEVNVLAVNREVLPSQNARLSDPANGDYGVVPGNILNVIVYSHLELNIPEGPQLSAAVVGFRVSSDGTLSYPFVGQAQAAGIAPEQIRANRMVSLVDDSADPQFVVRAAAIDSRAVNIIGVDAIANSTLEEL